MPMNDMSTKSALGLLLGLLLALPACFGSISQLESGKKVNTGKKKFDSYFDAVATLRDDVKDLKSDLFPIREPLTDELDLKEEIELPALISAVRKRAKKAKDYGVMLNLRLTPEPKLFHVKGKLDVDPRDEGMMRAVEEAASRAMTVFEQYSQLLAAIVQLDERRDKLAERIDRLDEDDPKRDVIETEIVGAGRVLAKAERKLRRDSRTLALYLVALAGAVDTGAMVSLDEECREAIEAKPKKRPRRKWRRPARPYKPPPKSGGDDFEM